MPAVVPWSSGGRLSHTFVGGARGEEVWSQEKWVELQFTDSNKEVWSQEKWAELQFTDRSEVSPDVVT